MKEQINNYKLVLGLEIHLHLKTKTKMFCGCDADIYGAEPNTHTCPTCLGLPGALPVPNFEAIQKVQFLGKALNCRINTTSRFDRKHYFYPDLPKGYQISQYKNPLCEQGFLVLDGGEKIEIERVHLEEDTAKSFHKDNKTLIDFNKSGMPLVEVVTNPLFKDISDAIEFSKKIQDTVRLLKIGDADMEKGQMRLEANISLRTAENERLDNLPEYKVEIKNINSFRFMEKAVNAEIIRQSKILDSGDEVLQENRGYDETTKSTVSQREKEESHDYRYFPEPDIPPMVFDNDYIQEISERIPELPFEIFERIQSQYKLSEDLARFFTFGKGLDLLSKFEKLCEANIDPNKIGNLLKNKNDYRDISVKEFLDKLQNQDSFLTDEEYLSDLVKKAIKENPKAVEDFKKGKEAAVEFLLGVVLRASQGKSDPNATKELIKKALGPK